MTEAELEARITELERRQNRFRAILSEILGLFDEQVKETRRRLSERIDNLEERDIPVQESER